VTLVSRAKPPVPARVLRDVQRELRRLEQQRDDADRAIMRLRQVLAWLTGARSGSPTSPQSLTTACRAALRVAPAGLTPLEVKHVLTSDGFRWTAFTSPMSAIHTVLKRLVSQGEALSTIDDAGHRRFVWKRRGWPGHTRTQAEESARIAHLLDGVVTEAEFEDLVERWRRRSLK
jgi:hypothetical protein